jgi:hypothetical protein
MMLPSRSPSIRSRHTPAALGDPRRECAGGAFTGGSPPGVRPAAEADGDGDADDPPEPAPADPAPAPVVWGMTVTAYAGVPALIGTTTTDEEVPS